MESPNRSISASNRQQAWAVKNGIESLPGDVLVRTLGPKKK